MEGISIIIPVYNTEKYVEKCIYSIVNEMKKVDQLIIIDDGSTDLSASICKRYICDNVSLITNDNHGVSFSRNMGINLAQNEYIMFVDSDDYLLSGWRSIIEKGINTGKDIVYFSKDSKNKMTVKEILNDILCLPKRRVLNINASACWGKIFKLKFIKENKIYFDCKLINGEDGFFCLQSIAKTNSYTILNSDEFYFYRTDNISSATHTFNEKFIPSNFQYISRLESELNSIDLYKSNEVNEIINYVTLQSIYLVMSKLSLIKERESRCTYYHYLNVFDDFFAKYRINWNFGIIQNVNFILLKGKHYDLSANTIQLIRNLRNIIKR